MYTIKFESVIGFYQEHNSWAYGELLKAARKEGSIVPFVGAGLSVAFGIKQWPNVLRESAKSVHAQQKRAEIEAMIDEKKYIDAAQAILDSYAFFLRQLPQRLGTPDLSNDRLYPSAAYLLPWLFPNQPVITTNFDTVLENVYSKQNHPFAETLLPNGIAQLTQVRQNNVHALVKLHGTIGETVDINTLVFTKEQYDKAYDPSGNLVTELQNWYSNRHLLFLGCSLEADETLRVLQSLIETGACPTHFAILGCKADEIDARTKQLGDLGIIPIFYDINNHDAVPVILDRLLEDVNNNAYQQLVQERSAMLPILSQSNNLLYDTEYVDFVGREEELKKLTQFCQSQATNAWWAVTGAGGMGKSRLVLEFTKRMKNHGWQCQWFRREEFERLQNWNLPTDPVIVVLDEVQSNADAAADWLSNAGQNRRSNKLRVILLERDGACYEDANWTRSIRTGSRYNDPLRRWCYQENFLRLSAPGEEDLKAMMLAYAQKAQKTVDADALLDTLREDEELMRPLYATAIAEAACNGEDPTNWDSEKILEVMLDRELRFHHNCMRTIMGRDPTESQYNQLERLIVQLCVHGAIPLEVVTETAYPRLTACADRLDMDNEEFFRGLGLLRENNTLRLDCPDLVKEYLVIKLVFDTGNWNQLLVGDWENDEKMWIYLNDRLLWNHTQRMKQEASFLRHVITAQPTQEDAAIGFAGLLWNIPVANLPLLIAEAADRLEQLHYNFPTNQWILRAFSAGLYNMTVETELDVRQKAVDRLAVLSLDNQEIAVLYASALVNLMLKQELEGLLDSVSKVEALHGMYPDNQEIAVQYASALVNLTIDQELEGRLDSVSKVEALHGKYPDNQEIAVEYVMTLVNLTVKQALEGLLDSVSKVEALHGKYPDNQEIAVQYAKTLVNLSAKQETDDLPDTVSKLETLWGRFSDNQEIAVAYAMALFNLCCIQDLDGCEKTVALLCNLQNSYRNNQKIAAAYARSLVALAFRQKTEAAVRGTLKVARGVLISNAENPTIQLYYAQVWFNLTLQQAEGDIPGTVDEIAAFLRGHPKAIPQFREALDAYLDEHPDHQERYKPLLELGGA